MGGRMTSPNTLSVLMQSYLPPFPYCLKGGGEGLHHVYADPWSHKWSFLADSITSLLWMPFPFRRTLFCDLQKGFCKNLKNMRWLGELINSFLQKWQLLSILKTNLFPIKEFVCYMSLSMNGAGAGGGEEGAGPGHGPRHGQLPLRPREELSTHQRNIQVGGEVAELRRRAVFRICE